MTGLDANRPPDAPLAAILCGPTAAGKTALAVAAAARLPLEAISVDSRQVYRRLDVGTAKPTAAERAALPHHLIDILDLHETYNAARCAAEALACAQEIRARGRVPLVVGGAGFYLKVLADGLFHPPYDTPTLLAVRHELADWSTAALRAELEQRDPTRAAAIHPHDRYRLGRALEICIAAGRSVTALTAERQLPERRFVWFRVVVERAALHRRIETRAEAMLRGGWLEEVAGVLAGGGTRDLPGLASLGYPHVVAHLEGRMDQRRMKELILRDTRRFARHQETWFRKARMAVPLPAADAPAARAALVDGLRRAFGA
jgi:tRNA dimethylallyltransferase